MTSEVAAWAVGGGALVVVGLGIAVAVPGVQLGRACSSAASTEAELVATRGREQQSIEKRGHRRAPVDAWRLDQLWTAGELAGVERRREMTRSFLLVATMFFAALWLPWAVQAQPSVPVWDTKAMAKARPPASPTPAAAEATAPVGLEVPPAPDPSADLGGYASAVVDAVRGGRWMVSFGLLLVGLVALARWGLGRVVPWFRTDRGGTVLAASTTVVAVVGSGLAARIPFGLDLLTAALAAAAGAIGLFVGAKRLVAPADQRPPAAVRLRPSP